MKPVMLLLSIEFLEHISRPRYWQKLVLKSEKNEVPSKSVGAVLSYTVIITQISHHDLLPSDLIDSIFVAQNQGIFTGLVLLV